MPATDKKLALDADLLKPEACAYRLQITRSRVYDLIKSGELESVKIGASRRVPRQALDSYITRLRVSS